MTQVNELNPGRIQIDDSNVGLSNIPWSGWRNVVICGSDSQTRHRSIWIRLTLHPRLVRYVMTMSWSCSSPKLNWNDGRIRILNQPASNRRLELRHLTFGIKRISSMTPVWYIDGLISSSDWPIESNEMTNRINHFDQDKLSNRLELGSSCPSWRRFSNISNPLAWSIHPGNLTDLLNAFTLNHPNRDEWDLIFRCCCRKGGGWSGGWSGGLSGGLRDGHLASISMRRPGVWGSGRRGGLVTWAAWWRHVPLTYCVPSVASAATVTSPKTTAPRLRLSATTPAPLAPLTRTKYNGQSTFNHYLIVTLLCWHFFFFFFSSQLQLLHPNPMPFPCNSDGGEWNLRIAADWNPVGWDSTHPRLEPKNQLLSSPRCNQHLASLFCFQYRSTSTWRRCHNKLKKKGLQIDSEMKRWKKKERK